MDTVTKKDLTEMETRMEEKFATKEDIGEMLSQQTKTLIEYVDGVRKELKRDIIDLRGDMLTETKRQIDKHVLTYHA